MVEALPPPRKKPGPPKGVRFGGRQKGTKNKTTEQKLLAIQIDAARRRGENAKPLAKDVLQQALDIAQDAVALYRPRLTKRTEIDAETGETTEVFEPRGGDARLFLLWHVRWVHCIEALAEYQSPKIRSVDAPAPPPDPNADDDQPRRRFTLRIFEGGKQITDVA